MTTPREEQPTGSPPVTPRVSTAPPRSRWQLGSVPSHVGRARTSTLVLAVLFVLVAALWIGVRPDPVQVTPTGGTGTAPVQQQPVAPTRARTTAPRTTPSAPSSSTTAGPTTSSAPTPTTVPGSSSAATGPPTTGSAAPASTTAPGAPVLPTTTAAAPTS